MKRFIFFIAVFFFIYPIFPKMLPLTTSRLFQVLGASLFLLHLITNRSRPVKLLLSKQFQQFIAITTLLFAVTFLAQMGRGDQYFFKKILSVYLNFFSAYFLYCLAVYAYEKVTVDLLIYHIVMAAVAQTFISFFFFLNPDVLQVYFSYLHVEANENVMERMGTISRRFIGVGNQFFTGSTNYGYSFLAIVVLPFLNKNRITKNKLIYGSAVALVAIGGIMTGRTVFVAIALGFLMLTILQSRSIFGFIKANLKIITYVLIALPVLYFFASLFIEPDRLNVVLGFVFEFYMNFSSGEGLETSSTNALKRMYDIVPDNLKTWLIGDGKMVGTTSLYYMRTDVGYLRLVFYFGVIGTLLFISTLFIYYRLLTSLTTRKALKFFFFMIFLWTITLNFKGLSFESHYFVVLLVFLVFSNNNRYKSNRT